MAVAQKLLKRLSPPPVVQKTETIDDNGKNQRVSRLAYIKAKNQALEEYDQLLAEFEARNVKLGTGEYISRAVYDELPEDNQRYLMEHGIEKYNTEFQDTTKPQPTPEPSAPDDGVPIIEAYDPKQADIDDRATISHALQLRQYMAWSGVGYTPQDWWKIKDKLIDEGVKPSMAEKIAKYVGGGTIEGIWKLWLKQYGRREVRTQESKLGDVYINIVPVTESASTVNEVKQKQQELYEKQHELQNEMIHVLLPDKSLIPNYEIDEMTVGGNEHANAVAHNKAIWTEFWDKFNKTTDGSVREHIWTLQEQAGFVGTQGNSFGYFLVAAEHPERHPAITQAELDALLNYAYPDLYKHVGIGGSFDLISARESEVPQDVLVSLGFSESQVKRADDYITIKPYIDTDTGKLNIGAARDAGISDDVLRSYGVTEEQISYDSALGYLEDEGYAVEGQVDVLGAVRDGVPFEYFDALNMMTLGQYDDYLQISPFITSDGKIDIASLLTQKPELEPILLTLGISQDDIDGIKSEIADVQIFLDSHTRIPSGQWFSNTDLDVMKEEYPELYEVLTKQGYVSYLQAVSESFSPMADTLSYQQSVKAYEDFMATHTEVGDNKWLANSELETMKLNHPEAYTVMIEQGWDAYESYMADNYINLDSGELVAKTDYDQLSVDDQVLLNELGTSRFKETKETEYRDWLETKDGIIYQLSDENIPINEKQRLERELTGIEAKEPKPPSEVQIRTALATDDMPVPQRVAFENKLSELALQAEERQNRMTEIERILSESRMTPTKRDDLERELNNLKYEQYQSQPFNQTSALEKLVDAVVDAGGAEYMLEGGNEANLLAMGILQPDKHIYMSPEFKDFLSNRPELKPLAEDAINEYEKLGIMGKADLSLKGFTINYLNARGVEPDSVEGRVLTQVAENEYLRLYGANQYTESSLIDVGSYLFVPMRVLQPDVELKDIKATEWVVGGAQIVLLAAPLASAPLKALSPVTSRAISTGLQTVAVGATLGSTIYNWDEMTPTQLTVALTVDALILAVVLKSAGFKAPSKYKVVTKKLEPNLKSAGFSSAETKGIKNALNDIVRGIETNKPNLVRQGQAALDDILVNTSANTEFLAKLVRDGGSRIEQAANSYKELTKFAREYEAMGYDVTLDTSVPRGYLDHTISLWESQSKLAAGQKLRSTIWDTLLYTRRNIKKLGWTPAEAKATTTKLESLLESTEKAKTLNEIDDILRQFNNVADDLAKYKMKSQPRYSLIEQKAMNRLFTDIDDYIKTKGWADIEKQLQRIEGQRQWRLVTQQKQAKMLSDTINDIEHYVRAKGWADIEKQIQRIESDISTRINANLRESTELNRLFADIDDYIRTRGWVDVENELGRLYSQVEKRVEIAMRREVEINNLIGDLEEFLSSPHPELKMPVSVNRQLNILKNRLSDIKRARAIWQMELEEILKELKKKGYIKVGAEPETIDDIERMLGGEPPKGAATLDDIKETLDDIDDYLDDLEEISPDIGGGGVTTKTATKTKTKPETKPKVEPKVETRVETKAEPKIKPAIEPKPVEETIWAVSAQPIPSTITAPSEVISPTPTITPSPTPLITPMPITTPSPMPIPTPRPDITPQPTPIRTPQPQPTPSPSPRPEPQPSPEPTPEPMPSPTPTPTPEPTPEPQPEPEPQPVPEPYPKQKPIPEPTPEPEPRPYPEPIPPPEPEPIPKPEPEPEPAPHINMVISPPPPPTPFMLPFWDDEQVKEWERKGYPAGTIAWRQGMFWKVIPPPYDTKRPINLSHAPKGAKKFATGEKSAYKTIQVLGGVPPKNVSVDLGWADVFISSESEDMTRIVFKSGGEQTVVGESIPSTTKGVTVKGKPELSEETDIEYYERSRKPTLSEAIEKESRPVRGRRVYNTKKSVYNTADYDRYYLGHKLPEPEIGANV